MSKEQNIMKLANQQCYSNLILHLSIRVALLLLGKLSGLRSQEHNFKLFLGLAYTF